MTSPVTVLAWATAFSLIWASPVLQLENGHSAQRFMRGSMSNNAARGNESMSSLLERYAPVFKLSRREVFYPSSIEYMLPHYDHAVDVNGDIVPINQSLITSTTLDQLPGGHNLFLSVSEPHNPQPFLLDPRSEYLYGPDIDVGDLRSPSRRQWNIRDEEAGRGDPEDLEISGRAGHLDGQEDTAGDDDWRIRGRVRAPVYGFWVDKGHDVVDLWYWTYYPFNFGKPIGAFGILGNHVSDWERLRVRTINGTAVSVDYNVHEGPGSAGTIHWSEVETVDDRPVAYVAAGSHGVWPTPGAHIYTNVLNTFKLVDLTDDDGPIWDTRHRVVPIQYWDGPEDKRRIEHTRELSWVDYRGHWGNRGQRGCWWHKLVGICQLVDGPTGPNRDFDVAPSCVLTRVVEHSSTFKFYLAKEMVEYAERNAVTNIRLEQICARPRKAEGETGDELEEDPATGQEGQVLIEGDSATHSWAVSGTTEFKGRHQHIINTLACKGRKSAVQSYRISLCKANGQCSPKSPLRRICTYKEGERGRYPGGAVDLEDVDEWDWAI